MVGCWKPSLAQGISPIFCATLEKSGCNTPISECPPQNVYLFRVGHIFRSFHPYTFPGNKDTHGINTARTVEVLKRKEKPPVSSTFKLDVHRCGWTTTRGCSTCTAPISSTLTLALYQTGSSSNRSDQALWNLQMCNFLLFPGSPMQTILVVPEECLPREVHLGRPQACVCLREA